MRGRLVLAVLLLSGLFALAQPAHAQPACPAPPMLGLPTFGFNACALPSQTYVFTNETDWRRFWNAGSARPAPRVDFTRWQVVAVALGARPNPGYAVQFLDYCRQGEDLVVRYQEWTPGADSVWTQQLTYPVDVVAVPAGGPLRFERQVGPRPVTSPAPRDVPPRPLDLSSLSCDVPEQFLTFTTPEAWQQFWCQYGQGPPPEVSFARGQIVAGVVGAVDCAGLSPIEVMRAGDRVTVTLGPAGPACPASLGQHSLLLPLPSVARVDFKWQPICR